MDTGLMDRLRQERMARAAVLRARARKRLVHVRTRMLVLRTGEPVVVRVRYNLGHRYRDWLDYPDERRRFRK